MQNPSFEMGGGEEISILLGGFLTRKELNLIKSKGFFFFTLRLSKIKILGWT